MWYMVAPGMDVIQEQFGNYDGKVVQFTNMTFLYERRSNLQGVLLKGIGVDVSLSN